MVDQYFVSRRVFIGACTFVGTFLLTFGVTGLMIGYTNENLLFTLLGAALCIGTMYIATNTPVRRR